MNTTNLSIVELLKLATPGKYTKHRISAFQWEIISGDGITPMCILTCQPGDIEGERTLEYDVELVTRWLNYGPAAVEALLQATFAIPTTHGAFETVHKAHNTLNGLV